MTNQIDNKTRRVFLKGLVYTSALSLAGISNISMAKPNTETALPTCDIHLLPTQNTGSEILSLYNHTDVDVTIDSIDKVNLDAKNKALVVKVNKLNKKVGHKSITLAPGETMQFEVSAISHDYKDYSIKNASSEIPNVLAGQLRVSSNHQAFDGLIPVTIFDSKTA